MFLKVKRTSLVSSLHSFLIYCFKASTNPNYIYFYRPSAYNYNHSYSYSSKKVANLDEDMATWIHQDLCHKTFLLGYPSKLTRVSVWSTSALVRQIR